MSVFFRTMIFCLVAGSCSTAWSGVEKVEIPKQIREIPAGHKRVFAAFPNIILLSGGLTEDSDESNFLSFFALESGRAQPVETEDRPISLQSNASVEPPYLAIRSTNSVSEWLLEGSSSLARQGEVLEFPQSLGFSAPTATLIFQSPKSLKSRSLDTEIPDGLRAVVWDASPETYEYALIFDDQNRVEMRGTKEGYGQLHTIVPGGNLLNLEHENGGVQILNIVEGYPEDSIFIEELKVDNPANLRTFIPHAMFGGTGQMLVVNNENRHLIIVELDFQKRRPLNYSAISLKSLEVHGDQEVIAISDSTLSRILLGVVGSDEILVFESDYGNFVRKDRVTLPFPISDMTAVPQSRDSHLDTFVFLEHEGTRIYQSPVDQFISGESIQVSSAASISADTTPALIAFSTDVTSELDTVKRLQFGLQELNYGIGIVDGVSGPKTETAIRSFQVDNGLAISGIADETTKQHLIARIWTKRLGSYHAAIASYPVRESGCAQAQEDVDEFAVLLKGTGLAELPLIVVKTSGKSPKYTVTVDAGGDKKKAGLAVEIIQRVSEKSANGKTGADSLILQNRDWTIDVACNRGRWLD